MLIQVPHFGDTIQVPHFRDTVQVPNFRDTVPVPHFRDTVQVPHFRDTVQVPHFLDTISVPHFRDTVQVPHFHNTVQVPHFHNTVLVPHFRDTVQVPHFRDTVQFRHQKIRTGVVLLNVLKSKCQLNPRFLIYTCLTPSRQDNRFCSKRQVPRGSFQASIDTWTTQRRSNSLTAEILDYECQRFLICVHIKISTASAPTQPYSDELNFKTRFHAWCVWQMSITVHCTRGQLCLRPAYLSNNRTGVHVTCVRLVTAIAYSCLWPFAVPNDTVHHTGHFSACQASVRGKYQTSTKSDV